MKKNKFAVFAASALAAVVAVSGCGGQNASVGGGTTGVQLSGVNEFPIVEKPMTLRIFSAKPTGLEDISTNEFTKWYDEKTGVTTEWEVANGDLRQAMNLKLASGDYADVWFNIGLSRSEQTAYYNQGVIIDMSDLVDKHGFYIKEMFQEIPEDEKEFRHTDNMLLGLPRAIRDYMNYAGNVMWVYEPWLEALNLEIPTTTEEFYEMLKAFKEKDPNGNGIADEIPLAGRKDRGQNTSVDGFILNAFNFSSRFGVYDKDGTATFAPIEDGYREGVRYMRRLYSEGLLHADNFIMDRSRIMALSENETPILGTVPSAHQGYFCLTTSPKKRAKDYVAIPPLKGPGGVRQTVAPTGWNRGQSFYNITTSCKNPELAIKWVDWLYSQEGYLKASSPGNVRLAKEGELGLDGTQAILAADPDKSAGSGTVQNTCWGDFGPGYASIDMFVKRCYNVETNRETAARRYDAYLKYKECAVETGITDFPLAPEKAEEFQELRTNITSAIDTGLASFIIGEKSIDSDWDSYVQNFYAIGLERYLELYQEYLDNVK